jgi:hypothetical protein
MATLLITNAFPFDSKAVCIADFEDVTFPKSVRCQPVLSVLPKRVHVSHKVPMTIDSNTRNDITVTSSSSGCVKRKIEFTEIPTSSGDESKHHKKYKNVDSETASDLCDFLFGSNDIWGIDKDSEDLSTVLDISYPEVDDANIFEASNSLKDFIRCDAKEFIETLAAMNTETLSRVFTSL